MWMMEIFKKYLNGEESSSEYPPITYYWTAVPLILDHSYLVVKLKSSKIAYTKSVRILEVLKLLFQQFLNLSSSQRDMSGPIIGDLSNNRISGGSDQTHGNTQLTSFAARASVVRSRTVSSIYMRFWTAVQVQRHSSPGAHAGISPYDANNLVIYFLS
jgi:hypothetical protein